MFAMRAAVVGAGAIGSGLDHGVDDHPLTHAGGYLAAGCELLALVDPADTVEGEAAKWGTRAYRDFGAMMQACRPELLSFAVPASVRPDLMMQALAHDCVRVVIAEKPLATSLDEAVALVAAYRKKGIPFIVNYSRRFVPVWQSLKGMHAISATIKYAKGIAHNGTHAIDLCRMLFGECLEAHALSGKFDYWPDDPTVTAHLRFERCPDVLFQGLDERCFTLFEVDIVGAAYRVIVDQDGRRVRHFTLRSGVGVPPGRRLVLESEADSLGGQAMKNLIQHAIEVASGKTVLCSGDDAIAALEIAMRLSEQFRDLQ